MTENESEEPTSVEKFLSTFVLDDAESVHVFQAPPFASAQERIDHVVDSIRSGLEARMNEDNKIAFVAIYPTQQDQLMIAISSENTVKMNPELEEAFNFADDDEALFIDSDEIDLTLDN